MSNKPIGPNRPHNKVNVPATSPGSTDKKSIDLKKTKDVKAPKTPPAPGKVPSKGADDAIKARGDFDAKQSVASPFSEVPTHLKGAFAPVVQMATGNKPQPKELAANKSSKSSKPKTVTVQHGDISIKVKELGAFKKMSPAELASRMAEAKTIRANDDTNGYSDFIAQYIHKNGDQVFKDAVATYNRDYGKNINPAIAPKKADGRFADRVKLGDRKRLVKEALSKDPHLTNRVLREMAKKDKYFNSKAHIAWSKAASARTAGKISPEQWRLWDPFGGTAGNGPDVVAGGKYPNVFSRIAMAHDTDHFLGRGFGVGPLAKLKDAEGFSHQDLGQVGLVPDHPLGHFFNVDSYVSGHPDWDVKYGVKGSGADNESAQASGSGRKKPLTGADLERKFGRTNGFAMPLSDGHDLRHMLVGAPTNRHGEAMISAAEFTFLDEAGKTNLSSNFFKAPNLQANLDGFRKKVGENLQRSENKVKHWIEKLDLPPDELHDQIFARLQDEGIRGINDRGFKKLEDDLLAINLEHSGNPAAYKQALRDYVTKAYAPPSDARLKQRFIGNVSYLQALSDKNPQFSMQQMLYDRSIVGQVQIPEAAEVKKVRAELAPTFEQLR